MLDVRLDDLNRDTRQMTPDVDTAMGTGDGSAFPDVLGPFVVPSPGMRPSACFDHCDSRVATSAHSIKFNVDTASNVGHS